MRLGKVPVDFLRDPRHAQHHGDFGRRQRRGHRRLKSLHIAPHVWVVLGGGAGLLQLGHHVAGQVFVLGLVGVERAGHLVDAVTQFADDRAALAPHLGGDGVEVEAAVLVQRPQHAVVGGADFRLQLVGQDVAPEDIALFRLTGGVVVFLDAAQPVAFRIAHERTDVRPPLEHHVRHVGRLELAFVEGPACCRVLLTDLLAGAGDLGDLGLAGQVWRGIEVAIVEPFAD